jgi:hypothetical protein
MADSEGSQDRDGDVPAPSTRERVPTKADRESTATEHAATKEPDRGQKPWRLLTPKVLIEVVLPLTTQLLTLWNAIHGTGG